MYALVVPLKVKPEMREKFLAAALEDSTCSLRDEPGCLRFDVLQDNSDPNKFFFYEVRIRHSLHLHNEVKPIAPSARTKTFINAFYGIYGKGRRFFFHKWG